MLRAILFLRICSLAASIPQSASESCPDDVTALLQREGDAVLQHPGFNILQVRRTMMKKASQCAKKYYKQLELLNLPSVYRTSWQPRKLPMTSRNMVIGAGMGTTGTHGLVVALEELGLHGYHYKDARASANEHAREHKLPEFLTEIVEGMLANTSQCLETIENFDFSQLPKNVDYVSDTPFTESFLDVYFQFPEAKVVLTTRPSLEWAKSRRKHGNSPPPVMRPCGLQGLKEYSDEDLASMLEAYHDLVRCVVPRKNLLELNLFEEGLNLTSSLMTFLEDRLPLVQAAVAHRRTIASHSVQDSAMQLHSAVFVLPRPIQSEAAGPKAEVKATEGGWRLEVPWPEGLDLASIDLQISDTEVSLTMPGGHLLLAWPQPVDSSSASAAVSTRKGLLILKASNR
ncbi:unnamed protein product [Symbiodinium microadriaticum]|nr:unnamed protein product [Symbiodinium microadriaticum]